MLESPAEEAARRLQAGVRSVEIAAALDDWMARQPQAERAFLLGLADALDADKGRVALRAAIAAGDLPRLRTVAETLDLKEQSPPSLALLASALDRLGQGSEALALLSKAQGAHPGDLWINHDLGMALLKASPSRPEESIGFLRPGRCDAGKPTATWRASVTRPNWCCSPRPNGPPAALCGNRLIRVLSMLRSRPIPSPPPGGASRTESTRVGHPICTPSRHSPGGRLMIRWIQRARHRHTKTRPSTLVSPESLEARIAPASRLAPPTILAPAAEVRVDLDATTIRGALPRAAPVKTTVVAFRDGNANGTYDAGSDQRIASVIVPRRKTAFVLPVTLNQDANNQFFLIARRGTAASDPVKAPLIVEDSAAPSVTAIARLGASQIEGGSAQFSVSFSEPVTGVDAADFQIARMGSVTADAAVSVAGSGASYTVTVANVGGTGTLALNLIDDDTIVDRLTEGTPTRPLGGSGTGNGGFNAGQTVVVTVPGPDPDLDADSLATVVLPALDLDLLGLRVQTSEITVSLSADAGEGKLLGNLLTTASNLIDLQEAADALNQVLSTTVGLLNSGELGIDLGGGTFDTRPESTTDILQLHVAPVNLDLLGTLVRTSPIDVSITAEAGSGRILGNIVADLANLFNDLPGQELNIDTLNQQLGELLGLVDAALGALPAAEVPTVLPAEGQILSLTVPALDLDLLGLKLETDPITVDAEAQEGDGNLLGNVLTSLLGTLDATPEKVAQLNNTLNGVLARVVGVLNAADLLVSPALVAALPPALQTLLSPVLVAPAGSTAPILDLVIASQDGTTPPVNVDLLGLVVTTSNIDARLSATTGDGQVLGNLLYNVASLADPNGASGLLSLLNALATGDLGSTAGADGANLAGTPAPAPQQLLQIQLDPLEIDLLGLEVRSDPIIVTISAQGGDAKLLGNLLGAISTLVNFQGVEGALNNALATTVNLVNSIDLSLPAGSLGSGVFDTGTAGLTPVLDVDVAPVFLDLLGLVVTTSPIHLTIAARSGDGLVLGNVVSALAHLFDNPPPELTIDEVNVRLGQLLADLNAQIPGIPPAETPPVSLDPGQFLELTVAAIDVNLLGLLLKTDPITVNATAQEGAGNLLGNFLSSLLNTIDATPGNLTVLNENLNALLAKVIGVLNAAELTLPQSTIDALPGIIRAVLSPVLIAPNPGETVQILDLVIASPDGTEPPVRADLLGLVVTTSDINAELLAQTGDGQILGNLLYNVANLINPGNPLSLLLLVTQLAQL